MKGKMDVNSTFRSDEKFKDYLGKILVDTGLSLGELVRISIPLALPQIKLILKSSPSVDLVKTVAETMLASQQD